MRYSHLPRVKTITQVFLMLYGVDYLIVNGELQTQPCWIPVMMAVIYLYENQLLIIYESHERSISLMTKY